MKQYSKLFSLVLLGSTAVALADCCSNDNNGSNCVIPFIQWRSQGRNMARKLEGTTSYAVYQGDMDNTYGTFNIALEYDQTFRGHNIAQCLFGNTLVNLPNTNNNNNCSNSCNDCGIVISGLGANGLGTGRAATALMAENFLLPRDFSSTISFSPKVQSVILDFDLFVGLDRWVNGLYFRLYGPVVWNKSKLDADENVISAGTAAGSYPQGFFDIATAVPNTSLFQNALSFFGGCQLPAHAGEAVTVQPLKFAKFSDCNLNNNNNNNCSNSCNGTSHHKTGFAELRGEFGWNYIADKYRFLINIQAAAPTGTRPNAEFLLPAYVGNGKHWELGGGIGGSWMMWGSEDGERSFNFIVEADITHLFNAKQKMTFDLKGKPLSRYMLAERLGTPAADAQLIPNTSTFAAPNVTAGVYMPVANFSTRDVKVGFGVQADLVAMFNYTHRGFSWDLGYNFWALSCSKISLSCDDECNNNSSCNPIIIPFPTNMALKGDASVVGYNPSDASNFALGLGATESMATIFTGTNAIAANATTPAGNPLTNLGVDAHAPAVYNNTATTPPTPTPLYVYAVPVATTAIQTSTTPVFISIDDLDVDGAKQRGLSNKVFTHFNYTWLDRSDKWVPYLGAGFSAEFGDHCGGNDDCSTPTVTTVTNNNNSSGCNSCKKCALTQWGVEVKGGVSFH